MKNYNLIGISGKKGSGKDTLSEFLINFDGEYQIRKYADKLKKIASLLTGRPLSYFYDRNHYSDYLPEWNMDIRKFQQLLGTEAIRKGLHSNAWVMSLFADYNDFCKWIITDVRFPNEAEEIQKHQGILIRINRPSVDDKDNHPSEVALDDWEKFDYIIDNSGTLKDLENEAWNLYQNLNI